MKIAVLGDIHGNLEALKAAYDAAILSGAEKVYHLGDLGGYAPFLNEVVDFLIEHDIEGVQGNYDEAVANGDEHCGVRSEDPLLRWMASLDFRWAKTHATPKTRNYLKALPSDISFYCEGHTVKICHATPVSNKLDWHEERDYYFSQDMARLASADIIIYGHTHLPYRKDIDGKVLINAGSVGKPKDKDARACVAVVEISRDVVNSEFLRPVYEVEKTALAIVECGLPAYFADKLREGR